MLLCYLIKFWGSLLGHTMENELTSSYKRRKPDDSQVSKMNFERIIQTLQSTPPRKPPKKSVIKKLQSANPENVFNHNDHDKRNSTGLVIKSKNQNKKVKKKQKRVEDFNSDKMKEIYKVYMECRNKSEKSQNEQGVNPKDYRFLVTPISEKRSETVFESSGGIKFNLTPSPRTPIENMIRIPSSYKRQKIARHKKVLNN